MKATEIRRLKACVGDLMSVLSIPAISAGSGPRDIVAALLDVLLGMLRLDFVCGEFADPMAGTSIILARTAGSTKPSALHPEIRRAIEPWWRDRSQASPFVARRFGGGGDIRITPWPIGLREGTGWILTASRRANFPTPTERLVLSVAANQAAIGLQDARLLAQQKCVARELDQRVAQRTRELQTANDELKRALEEVHELKDALKRENMVLRGEVSVARGGLAPWQARRAKELMLAKLDEQIPLSRLAEECGLSVRHFARAFRQSTGVPPHRWLLNHRVERAKELLIRPAISLADVALACGFADQSHFTRIFTAVVNLSPGLWRRMQMWRLPIGEAAMYRPPEPQVRGAKRVAAGSEMQAAP